MGGISSTPAQAASLPAMGMADNNLFMFSNPLYTSLGIRYNKQIVMWDVALRRDDRFYKAKEWARQSLLSGARPLTVFAQDHAGKVRAPSIAQYTRAARAFHKAFPEVKEITPWNEANLSSEPTYRKPKLAARYTRIWEKLCRKCTVTSVSLVDNPKTAKWIKTYRKALGHRPKVWNLHNYNDVHWKSNSTPKMLKLMDKSPVWITETGGISRHDPARLKGTRHFRTYNPAKAAVYERRAFAIANKYRNRVRRIYHYHWLAAVPSIFNDWDSALINPNGKPRAGYYVVLREARKRGFGK
jgi:hypothetical protein